MHGAIGMGYACVHVTSLQHENMHVLQESQAAFSVLQEEKE
jgi:hypothetical protein